MPQLCPEAPCLPTVGMGDKGFILAHPLLEKRLKTEGWLESEGSRANKVMCENALRKAGKLENPMIANHQVDILLHGVANTEEREE